MYKKLSIIITFFIITGVGSANAVTIDLNDFFADSTIAVVPDGSTALIEEDAFLTPVILSNDPGLGDPNVIPTPLPPG